MGVKSPAVDAMIDALLGASDHAGLVAATRALDRVLMAGRYVVPLWQYQTDRIAHSRYLAFPDHTPVYGDRPEFLPEVWWNTP